MLEHGQELRVRDEVVLYQQAVSKALESAMS